MRLSRGNVTGAIAGLLEQGLIEPAGEVPRRDLGGMPRKLYRLTGSGAAEAERQRQVLAALLAMSHDAPSGMAERRWVEPDEDEKLLPSE